MTTYITPGLSALGHQLPDASGVPTTHQDPPSAGYPPPPGNSLTHPSGPPVIVRSKTNGLAVAALILGIVWIFWIGSVLALAFGYIAKRQIDNSNGEQAGRGLAIAGIVLGGIGVGVLLLIILTGGGASVSFRNGN